MLLLIIGFLGYRFVVNPILIKQEKKRFEAAKVELRTLVDEIVGVAGTPVNIEDRSGCQRPSLKFEEGPLSCHVSWYIRYENITAEEANKKMNDTSPLLGDAPLRYERTDYGDGFLAVSSFHGDQRFYKDIVDSQGLSCSSSFRYNTRFDKGEESNLEIGVSCNSGARLEHYPTE